LNGRPTVILHNGSNCVSAQKIPDVGRYLPIDNHAKDCCWGCDVTVVKTFMINLQVNNRNPKIRVVFRILQKGCGPLRHRLACFSTRLKLLASLRLFTNFRVSTLHIVPGTLVII